MTTSDRLARALHQILTSDIPVTPVVRKQYATRLREGKLTRNENPLSHFATYVFPFNPKTQEVFLVHHKKANSWIAPGGHIDPGEIPIETFVREAKEELGTIIIPDKNQQPFLLTIADISKSNQVCKTHYDLWYLLTTDGKDFSVDLSEFYDTKWMSIAEAKNLVVSEENLQAIDVIRRQY